MNRTNDEILLSRCLDEIESKLNWGKREDWTHYDFEKLSENIHTVTHITLSVTTLKRIFGKLKYENFPTLTTLNTLARYADYSDWRNFTQQTSALNTEAKATPVEEPPRRRVFPHFPKQLIGLAFAILLLLIGYALISSERSAHYDPDDFEFRANKVLTEGVPNSVVFHYDAKAADTDSVFIVQTWDIRRKTLVPGDGHEHSAMYYYPGFFRTKLIVDGVIVKTHDLQIATEGWLCLAEAEGSPVYFDKEEYIRGDSVTVNEDILKKYNLPLHPIPPRIRFFHQGDMGALMNDNFIFETKIKNPFNKGSNACQHVQVLIQCKDDIIIIPLSAKACIGELRLFVAGAGVDSRHGDLSGFGCDLNEWVTLRVVTKDRSMKLLVNGKQAYTLTFPNSPTDIVGVQYRFNGPGAVKETWFEGAGMVYAF